jgi:hypothetical protein
MMPSARRLAGNIPVFGRVRVGENDALTNPFRERTRDGRTQVCSREQHSEARRQDRARCVRRDSVVQHDAQQRVVDREGEAAVVFNESEFLELVEEEVHSRARRPDHFRQRFL